jgi:ATP-binding cassette subfamily C (CFTR/MRP) protein 1
MFLDLILQVLGAVGVAAYVLPWVLIPVVPAMRIYGGFAKYFRSTSRELQRLESVSRAPIFAQFGETLAGTSTIRAYRDSERFEDANMQLIEANETAWYCFCACNRWLGYRLDILGTTIAFIVSLICVTQVTTLEPGLIGLALVQIMSVTGRIGWVVRSGVDLETKFTYVERVGAYTDLEQEPPRRQPDYDPPTSSSTAASSSFPSDGAVRFEAAELRYRPGLPLALKGISIDINGGEKVGVVGRTGSGKSTLTNALFRMVELAGGRITIDGHDIAQLGLDTLRQALAIIPQEPVMFTGTMRENLDPWAEYSDGKVWDALAHVRLESYIREQEGGLSMELQEGGANLSVGQRQLVCLARALLRQPKVLLLDEATASVDYETDRLIQLKIRSEFRQSTVITVAHRLNTVMDADRMLVLAEGKVVEFDSPRVLLTNADGYLSKMVANTGNSASHLLAIANGDLEAFEATTPTAADGRGMAPQ